MIIITADTDPYCKVTFALAYSLLVSLPLMRSAGFWHIGGLLPPQALTKLVHLRGHVLPGTVGTERGASLVERVKIYDTQPSDTNDNEIIEEIITFIYCV